MDAVVLVVVDKLGVEAVLDDFEMLVVEGAGRGPKAALQPFRRTELAGYVFEEVGDGLAAALQDFPVSEVLREEEG
jgi:hypothetical protein